MVISTPIAGLLKVINSIDIAVLRHILRLTDIILVFQGRHELVSQLVSQKLLYSLRSTADVY